MSEPQRDGSYVSQAGPASSSRSTTAEDTEPQKDESYVSQAWAVSSSRSTTVEDTEPQKDESNDSPDEWEEYRSRSTRFGVTDTQRDRINLEAEVWADSSSRSTKFDVADTQRDKSNEEDMWTDESIRATRFKVAESYPYSRKDKLEGRSPSAREHLSNRNESVVQAQPFFPMYIHDSDTGCFVPVYPMPMIMPWSGAGAYPYPDVFQYGHGSTATPPQPPLMMGPPASSHMFPPMSTSTRPSLQTFSNQMVNKPFKLPSWMMDFPTGPATTVNANDRSYHENDHSHFQPHDPGDICEPVEPIETDINKIAQEKARACFGSRGASYSPSRVYFNAPGQSCSTSTFSTGKSNNFSRGHQYTPRSGNFDRNRDRGTAKRWNGYPGKSSSVNTSQRLSEIGRGRHKKQQETAKPKMSIIQEIRRKFEKEGMIRLGKPKPSSERNPDRALEEEKNKTIQINDSRSERTSVSISKSASETFSPLKDQPNDNNPGDESDGSNTKKPSKSKSTPTKRGRPRKTELTKATELILKPTKKAKKPTGGSSVKNSDTQVGSKVNQKGKPLRKRPLVISSSSDEEESSRNLSTSPTVSKSGESLENSKPSTSALKKELADAIGARNAEIMFEDPEANLNLILKMIENSKLSKTSSHQNSRTRDDEQSGKNTKRTRTYSLRSNKVVAYSAGISTGTKSEEEISQKKKKKIRFTTDGRLQNSSGDAEQRRKDLEKEIRRRIVEADSIGSHDTVVHNIVNKIKIETDYNDMASVKTEPDDMVNVVTEDCMGDFDASVNPTLSLETNNQEDSQMIVNVNPDHYVYGNDAQIALDSNYHIYPVEGCPQVVDSASVKMEVEVDDVAVIIEGDPCVDFSLDDST